MLSFYCTANFIIKFLNFKEDKKGLILKFCLHQPYQIRTINLIFNDKCVSINIQL